MNKKRWIIIATVLVLIMIGVLAGILYPRGGNSENSTPVIVKEFEPTPTPALQQSSSDQSIKVVSVQELVANAKAGKYQKGAIVEVSGIYYEGPAVPSLMTFCFGPKTEGYFIIVDPAGLKAPDFGRLTRGNKAVVYGRYGGFQKEIYYTMPTTGKMTDAERIWHDGLLLTACGVVSVEK